MCCSEYLYLAWDWSSDEHAHLLCANYVPGMGCILKMDADIKIPWSLPQWTYTLKRDGQTDDHNIHVRLLQASLRGYLEGLLDSDLGVSILSKALELSPL